MKVKLVLNDYKNLLARQPNKDEISCFRSLMEAVAKNTSNYTKEIHGRKYLVKFSAKRASPHRPVGRCELSDILFVIIGKKSIKVSFIQAKREKKQIQKFPFHLFANLEQWDLLHNQATVSASGKKFIPSDILKSSYSSIASFIFFHPMGGTHEVKSLS